MMAWKWNTFDRSIYVFTQRNSIFGSFMRNCVILIFTLMIVNNFNVKVLGASTEVLTEPSSFLNKSELLKRNGGGVSNIRIVPEYNSQRNKIILNVTWDKPTGDPPIQYYDFKIFPNSTYPECRWKPFQIIRQNKSLTSIYLPPLLHWYEVDAGCSYIISVIADRSREGKFKKDVLYTVPECVGKKCSCTHLNPQVNNVSVYEFAPGKLNISWEINHDGTNETIFNITKVLFEYRPLLTENNHLNPFSALKNPNMSYNLDYFIVDEAYNIFTLNQTYELQATFYNMFDCKITNHTNFMDKQRIYMGDCMLTILVSLIILIIIYLARRNRLILREIIHDPIKLCCVSRRHRQPPQPPSEKHEVINIIYHTGDSDDEPENLTDEFEFPRRRLKIQKVIGEGAFGLVYLAKAVNINNKLGDTYVAVKTLRDHAPEQEQTEFFQEIETLKKIGNHKNVVKLLGCCSTPPFLMIMEFVPCGDLKNYLLELRTKWEKRRTVDDTSPVFFDSSDGGYILPTTYNRGRMVSDGPSLAETESTYLSSPGPSPTESYVTRVESTLDHTELQNFALQIARGMEHLEKIPIAHRDLAARNILINEFKELKVSDFGLSRMGPYVNGKRNKMPLRWMSLEAIEDNFYDSKSDVWSFAVVLWEIGTLGAFPYEQVSNEMCWSKDPDLRPSFKELVELLDLQKKIYVDFSQVNPLYMFPPAKE
ncbi:hypothetical protein FQR65_LT06535 [Abscondita terminalis]|nr:hypothetical protein FQR65_LT06535 [Abscondita terminalis]